MGHPGPGGVLASGFWFCAMWRGALCPHAVVWTRPSHLSLIHISYKQPAFGRSLGRRQWQWLRDAWAGSSRVQVPGLWSRRWCEYRLGVGTSPWSCNSLFRGEGCS